MKCACLVLLLISFQSHSQSLFTLLPTSKTGINFSNNIKETSTQNVLSYEYFYNGGGVAVGDLNNDQLPDIVFTANMDQPKVYFNKGDFSFEDVTRKSRIQAEGWKTGVTMADVNADGWLDVYICRSGNGNEDSRKNLLFINQKNGTFREMGEQYGLADKGHSTHAVFFDYDNDGDLDMFLLNHSIKRLKGFDVAYVKAMRDSLSGDKLFRNDGTRFTDVSVKAGIIGNPICFGLGVAVADFNNDGWSDLYVSNDYDEDDYLYINQKNGTFKESLTSYMGHTSKFSMGCDVADINNDALTDLFTLDMLPEDNKRQKLLKGPDGYDFFEMLLKNGYYYQYMRNMLHLAVPQNNDIQYSEIGQLAGISSTDWSWSALFGDYDLDGWQDLFITNGYMRDYTNLDFIKYAAPDAIRKARQAGSEPNLFDLVQKMPSSRVMNYIFKNTGKLDFQNMDTAWGMNAASLSNGAAYGDFDNDGDWDIVVNNINQPAFIWQNHAEELKNNYLKIKFTGSEKNPFGIGAKVIVTGDDGYQQLQQLEWVHGYQSSTEPCLIYGLGKRKTVTVKVIWPNGDEQVSQQETNQTITLDQKNAVKQPAKEKLFHHLFTDISDSSLFTHAEDDFNDFKREPLLPHQYSKYGPALAAADVNGDGKKDLFVGGAKGQADAIYINEGNGKFIKKDNPVFETHRFFEDVLAAFGDFDKDGDMDVYVLSGGNEADFQDRIYWNDSQGNFSYKENVLPPTPSSGGSITLFDFDNDGDLDIFRGGQVSTGSYPEAPESFLLQNSNGKFSDVTPGFLKYIGMISSAEATDINHDGINDLVLAGEYMPVTILTGQNKAPYFTSESIQELPHSTGWWYLVQANDIDNDGDLDIIAGNYGLNSQMKPGPEQPLTADAADIDNNGSMDAIISYYIQGKSYPVATRDELLDQVPSFRAKYPSYESYSNATVNDFFTKDQFAAANHLKVEEFRSGIFINDNSSFHFAPFPREAQAFPVRDVQASDFNHDGTKDLLLTGNNFGVRAQTGKNDAGKGLLLIQDKDKNFSPGGDTGFYTNKDARRMVRIDNFIIVANNNDKIQVFRID